jgi:hypothetical protein
MSKLDVAAGRCSLDHIVGQCPKCGSRNIAGLIAAFWVRLDKDGQPKDQWRDCESETELTEKRSCGECGHEWDDE